MAQGKNFGKTFVSILLNQRKLFFIIGIGRSGTTLLQEIMNTFEGFCNLKESMIGEFPHGSSVWSYVRKSNDFSHLESFIQNNWTKEFFVEKTPDSVLCLSELAKKFSDANYLFLERNPKDIALSQLNLFYNEEMQAQRKQQDLKNFMISEYDIKLNFEQYITKMVLKMIKCQVENKLKFCHSLTISYNNLVESLRSQLEQVANNFNITPNYQKAVKNLSRKTASLKHNRYEIKKLSDPHAIELINEGCQLWGY